MKILIMQFSGTGNTYTIAKIIQDGLIKEGHYVDLYPIEKIADCNELIKEYDLVGIGYPIYGSDIPQIIYNIINKLQPENSKKGFIFCTQLMFSGDGAAYVAKKLVKKGFIIRQLAHFNMPNNITDSLGFIANKTNYDKLLKRKQKQVDKFVKAINKDKRKMKGKNIFSNILGLIQRIPFQKFEKSFYEHAIKIEDTCILCKKCIDLCPVDNFSIKDNKLIENDKCILCYRCINHCPTKSLHISKKKLVKKPYKGPVKNFDIDDVKKIRTHQEAKNN
ncbi:MAG: EFR1 family ferrodoxin [Candidatus Izimaplasma sp.]|nr:EFR1 family ferrodoxin [Candidatus Izimaplasma bacterium]